MAELLHFLPNSTSLQSLLVLEEAQLVSVFNKVMDNILGRQVTYTDIVTNSKLSVSDMDRLAVCLDAFVVSQCGNHYNVEDCSNMLNSLQLQNASEIILSTVEARKEEVKRALIERASTLFPCILEDINWSVRVTIASSKSASMRIPTTILTLHLRDLNNTVGNGQKTQVSIELSAKELDSLISTLSQPIKVAHC